jgi:hypothetical protein
LSKLDEATEEDKSGSLENQVASKMIQHNLHPKGNNNIEHAARENDIHYKQDTSQDSNSENEESDKKKKDKWLTEDSGDEGMEALNEVRRLVGKPELKVLKTKSRSMRHVLCDSEDEENDQSLHHLKKKHTLNLDSEEDDRKISKYRLQRKLNRAKRMRKKYPKGNPFVLSDCSEASDDHASTEASLEELSSNEGGKYDENLKRKPVAKQKDTARTQHCSDESANEVYIDIDQMVRKMSVRLFCLK